MHPLITASVANQVIEERMDTARRVRAARRRRLFARRERRDALPLSPSPGRLRPSGAGR
jgi:hypothetical protein